MEEGPWEVLLGFGLLKLDSKYLKGKWAVKWQTADHNLVIQHVTHNAWLWRTAKRPYRTEWPDNKMAGYIFPLNQPRKILELKKLHWREKIITSIFMLTPILSLTPAEDARPKTLPRGISGGSVHPFTPGAAAFIRSKWAAACGFPHRRLHLGDGAAFSFATLLLCMRNCNLVPDVTFLSLS